MAAIDTKKELQQKKRKRVRTPLWRRKRSKSMRYVMRWTTGIEHKKVIGIICPVRLH